MFCRGGLRSLLTRPLSRLSNGTAVHPGLLGRPRMVSGFASAPIGPSQNTHSQLTRHDNTSSASNNAPLPLVKHRFGIDLCGKIARLLSENGVENLLWGSHLLATYTVSVASEELAFAVPRSQFHTAIGSLEARGIPLCREKNCSWSRWQEKAWNRSGDQKPPHFHLDLPVVFNFPGPDRNTVQLHAVEDVLWEVSVEGRGVGFSDGIDNNIIFAHDPGLREGSPTQGWGRFPASCPGVRLPTWQRYVEALILLSFSSDDYASSFWNSELYFATKVGSPDQLGHPAFTRYLKFLKRPFYGSKGRFQAEMAKTKEALGPRLRPPRGV